LKSRLAYGITQALPEYSRIIPMKALSALCLASLLTLALNASAQDAADAPAEASKAGDPVILKADGEDIHKSEVDDAWKAVFQGRQAPPIDSLGGGVKDKFLREVASEHVLYKEAEKEGIENTPSAKAMLEKLKRQIIISELLREKTRDAVTDDKLKASYQSHLKDQGNQEEYKARHILVKTKEAADDIEKRLKGGEEFDKLAKELSDDKSSGAAGGDLGWFTADKMVPEFGKTVEKMKKGEVSQPVKTEFGWHVIELEDKRKSTPPAFADVKDTLKDEVGNKAVTEYVKNLMKDIKITQVDASGKETPVPPPGNDAADNKAQGKGDKGDKESAASDQ
jgi:peptidyl-prolyl cis-trans isomerase C